MILYYNKPDIELDDWHKVVVKIIVNDTFNDIANCDELIPSNVILCDDKGIQLYKVGESRPLDNNVGWQHKIEKILVPPIKSKQYTDTYKEEVLVKTADILNKLDDGNQYEIEHGNDYGSNVEQQLEEDLNLYGTAYYIINDYDDKERIDPTRITVMTRTKK